MTLIQAVDVLQNKSSALLIIRASRVVLKRKKTVPDWLRRLARERRSEIVTMIRREGEKFQ